VTNKYNAISTEVDGIRFQSRREAQRYVELRDAQARGEITGLERQVRYPIRVNDRHICAYLADFRYLRGAETVVEDVKGYKTDVYKIKRKLVEALYSIKINET
jgi:hypothetical protein